VPTWPPLQQINLYTLYNIRISVFKGLFDFQMFLLLLEIDLTLYNHVLNLNKRHLISNK
jgi:hypothetical protein